MGLLAALISASVVAPSAAQAAGSWSKHAFPFGTELQLVSCSSSSFCAVVGTFERSNSSTFDGGETFNGSSWGAPKRIYSQELPSALSCTSRSFCLAGGDEAYAYNDASWGKTRRCPPWRA
jgi:hypothetical protein